MLRFGHSDIADAAIQHVQRDAVSHGVSRLAVCHPGGHGLQRSVSWLRLSRVVALAQIDISRDSAAVIVTCFVLTGSAYSGIQSLFTCDCVCSCAA
jgi:hypothetical protein